MKQLVAVPKDELEHVLKTEEIDAYFYWDYWEFCSAHFEHLKAYPAGTLTVDMLETELNQLYEKHQDLFDYYLKVCGHSVISLIYIGYFDDKERDFHVIAWKGQEETEE